MIFTNIPVMKKVLNFTHQKSNIKLIDSIYTFYSDDSLKHSIYTISANDLKQLTASSSKLFANNAYQAVFANNKIQYMHIREREKIQPLNWNKKDSDYLEYENLRLYITAQDYSPYTNIKDFEITLNFYLINWLFFVKNSDFPYYFDTSQIYIISNGNAFTLFQTIQIWCNKKFFPLSQHFGSMPNLHIIFRILLLIITLFTLAEYRYTVVF